jgi:hypothetical protein
MIEKIKEILSEEKVLALCVSNNNEPYCANSFYAIDFANLRLIIIGDKTTKHLQIALQNNKVAGTIYRVKGAMHTEGLQFTGNIFKTSEKNDKELYFKRFPFARMAKTDFWVIEIKYIKCSLFNKGISKKFEWKNN